ncbi:DUF294 nucleotidyltransferase-like domain-containing protein [Fodinisporobacter ferrooxydans]|uniref:DUF294 nucleotidyltransferase-like domain-containing protein n=1 Tax=Fodinisporobacter ferrooxydans TaxID=2901836 RepID=A0ABY4CMV4_9BACL|nr:DUF294 nucleotidyltransferase-like domain-containing protein [Alicyclobacillaceae bacterium MYW30-H2]
MIEFPMIDSEWILDHNATVKRAQWWQDVILKTRDWLEEDGDIRDWMIAFRELREELLNKAWKATVPSNFREDAHYILFGSGGRGEDLLYSDLDHAVLLREDVRLEDLQQYLYAFIRIMNELGCPPCQGFVMSTNTRWIGSPTEWKDRIKRYFEFPDWDHARYLFMIADARPLDGYVPGWLEILQGVLNGIRQSAFICWEMAHLGIHRSVAISVFRRLKSKREEQREIFNIKEGLLNPIIHSLRLLAVANGFYETSTWKRNEFLNQQGILPNNWKIMIEEALLYGWKVRLQVQVKELCQNQPVTDVVVVSEYTKNARDELMTHLETAKLLERWTHRQFRKPR